MKFGVVLTRLVKETDDHDEARVYANEYRLGPRDKIVVLRMREEHAVGSTEGVASSVAREKPREPRQGGRMAESKPAGRSKDTRHSGGVVRRGKKNGRSSKR
jgi:hypothetical protein